MEQKVYDLEERLIVFAAKVVKYVDRMPTSFAGKYYAGQLLRSGALQHFTMARLKRRNPQRTSSTRTR